MLIVNQYKKKKSKLINLKYWITLQKNALSNAHTVKVHALDVPLLSCSCISEIGLLAFVVFLVIFNRFVLRSIANNHLNLNKAKFAKYYRSELY